ncbi:MAG: hypothetical protein RhofKO_02360 [Rhodothermales bacterium]
MKILSSLLVSLLFVGAVQAQRVGTCDTGAAQAYLDANNVQAALYNTGSFFFRNGSRIGEPHYRVPKDGNAEGLFAMPLWVGGLAPDSTLRFVGTNFGPYEFWPGPLDASGSPPGDCTEYDRMYSVRDADIRAYEANGSIIPDLRDWPHHLGAPVVDGDGVQDNYNLAGGDRPHIYGDQSIWWVMNDVGNTKWWSESPPIGLEVQVQAFSAACVPALETDRSLQYKINDVVNHTTFYHVKLIHKGEDPLSDTYIGWQTFSALGNDSDNFIGSDTLLHMAMHYNAFDVDEGERGYGTRPPAIGFMLTQGVSTDFDGRDNDQDGVVDEHGERLPFTNIMMHNLGWSFRGALKNYFFMQSLWHPNYVGGSRLIPLTEGGEGWGGTVPTKFSFPGDPVTRSYWSEEKIRPSGQRGYPHDKDILASTGPFDFTPGDTTDFVLAIPWARGDDRLQSVSLLRHAALIAQEFYDDVMQYDLRTCEGGIETVPEHPDALGYYILRQNYPEPFSQQTTIRYEVIDTVPVELHVYDLLGRRVRTLVDGVQAAGVYDVVFEAGGLPTGTYFYRLEAAGYVSITRRMVLQR